MRFAETSPITRALLSAFVVAAALFMTVADAVAQDPPPPPPQITWDPNDPRIGLGPGWLDAESAIRGMEHLAAIPRAEGFYNPSTPADGRFNNTDLAFRGNLLYQGNYNGFQIYDISEPADPTLRVSVVCPGGQGDVSVWNSAWMVGAWTLGTVTLASLALSRGYKVRT